MVLATTWTAHNLVSNLHTAFIGLERSSALCSDTVTSSPACTFRYSPPVSVDWPPVLANSGHPCYVEPGINARPQAQRANSLVPSATVGVAISNSAITMGAISTFSIATFPRVGGRLTAQQDLGEQTDLRQNPEKFHDRWSHTYSAQMPLSGKVPQPMEHRWPVYRQAV